MTFDTYTAERLAEYRMRDAMREAEQARLAQVAQGPAKARQWRSRMVLDLRKLRALVVDRSLDNYVAGFERQRASASGSPSRS
jgi:hypothetical protein